MNVLEFMTNFERDCLNFFETIGSTTDNPELVELYKLLADAQKRHLANLEGIMATREGGRETELLDRIDSHELGLGKLLFDHDQIRALNNDRDSFEHVVSAEEEIIRLFEGMAKTEENEATSRLLAKLAEGERKHLKEIEGIYEFVEKPEYFLAWGEFSNLKTL